MSTSRITETTPSRRIESPLAGALRAREANRRFINRLFCACEFAALVAVVAAIDAVIRALI